MVRLYTSTPDAPAPWFIVDQIRRQTGQDVQVLPLAALHQAPPGQQQRLAQEQDWRNLRTIKRQVLQEVQAQLALAEAEPHRWPQSLADLRGYRERLQREIASISGVLGEAEQPQEGGQVA